MPQTPDRFPGISDEEGVNFEESPDGLASSAGELRYYSGRFSLYDSSGEYDPRSGGGISEAQHKTLRQLIHFIDDGPAEGFPSGSYKETLPSGATFPTSEIWWESSSKLKKIVELSTTWSGVNITQEQWRIYGTDGSTVLWIITDAISYSGVFETTRTRTIAAGP